MKRRSLFVPTVTVAMEGDSYKSLEIETWALVFCKMILNVTFRDE